MLMGTETPKRAFVSNFVLRPPVEERREELSQVVEPAQPGEEHRQRVGGYRPMMPAPST
jgi:hypothetical protein